MNTLNRHLKSSHCYTAVLLNNNFYTKLTILCSINSKIHLHPLFRFVNLCKTIINCDIVSFWHFNTVWAFFPDIECKSIWSHRRHNMQSKYAAYRGGKCQAGLKWNDQSPDSPWDATWSVSLQSSNIATFSTLLSATVQSCKEDLRRFWRNNALQSVYYRSGTCINHPLH